ncbi:hypothetical protein SETIT_1G332900v2 [Setaria italica]|uniref:DUF7036 domain-containing protein n=1 Tax=Setaria italica TaxID=4555 RepID=K3YT39_SETIT|nr:uncharacterized protein LOC101783008 [Setaria italica]XP_022678824.1 uncharacterized protein LOC101783008 [Setaria italica]RCV08515.1 hypothetical protein SETIT_1G332900v2 [Setaria italica]
MGKAGRAEQAFPNGAPATRFSRCRCGAVVGKVVSAKCASVLLLAVGGFLSAAFVMLHLRASGGGVPDDPDILAEIEAGFILLVPHSQIASQGGTLEKEIYDQIGVPNSKVSVSMRPYNYTNTTYVKFGVLPDPRNASMSVKSINTLRTSLIRLTLQQLNLSLTPSVFGDPLCLEILGFPGGITVLLPHNASHADSIQPIFNITFDSTIHEVREFLKEMKNELAIRLQQTPDEELFVKLTNTNGSTVAAPVTVQVSIAPIDRSNFLQPYRLKQLAQIITEWSSRNLGLNTLIFGRIRDLKLSPLLEAFIPSCAPSLPPMPTPFPSWPPISERPKTNAYRGLSCPALVKKQNEATPHRRLMRVSPQLSTWLHRKYASEGKKNSIALVAPTFIAPVTESK